MKKNEDWGQQDLTDNTVANESKVSMEIKIQAEVEKIWINYDLDQNGILDFEEVCKYLKERCPHIPNENMKEQFDIMDQNGDGKIDKEEMF